MCNPCQRSFTVLLKLSFAYTNIIVSLHHSKPPPFLFRFYHPRFLSIFIPLVFRGYKTNQYAKSFNIFWNKIYEKRFQENQRCINKVKNCKGARSGENSRDCSFKTCKLLTISCIVLKNSQTYFKNLPAWTPHNFQSMCGHFSTLSMKKG